MSSFGRRRTLRCARSLYFVAFITTVAVLLAVAILHVPFAAEAQQAVRVPRIGFLSASSLSDSRTARNFEAFRQGLRELGYVEGQNITIEARWADGKYERLPGLAAELVLLKVDIIVAYGVAVQAAQQATGTIPIVMAVVIDPVGAGFVASSPARAETSPGCPRWRPRWSGSCWSC